MSDPEKDNPSSSSPSDETKGDSHIRKLLEENLFAHGLGHEAAARLFSGKVPSMEELGHDYDGNPNLKAKADAEIAKLRAASGTSGNYETDKDGE